MTKFIKKTPLSEKTIPTNFVKNICSTFSLNDALMSPKAFDYVELIYSSKKPDVDFMIAYNEGQKGTRNEVWYLGHWNDGC